jgi:hypothetical protein
LVGLLFLIRFFSIFWLEVDDLFEGKIESKFSLIHQKKPLSSSSSKSLNQSDINGIINHKKVKKLHYHPPKKKTIKNINQKDSKRN